MPYAAGWAVLGLLACLPFVFDSSVPEGPRAPFGLLLLVLLAALPALVGGGFAVFEGKRPDQPDYLRLLGLVRRLSRPIRVGAAAVALAGAGLFLAGMVSMPSGTPARTGTGYAVRLKNGEVVPVSEQRYLTDRRAERRVFLGMAVLANAGGAARSAGRRSCATTRKIRFSGRGRTAGGAAAPGRPGSRA
nr:hypothetical protein GCM10020092_053030 [Actinoplanes digitatis]